MVKSFYRWSLLVSLLLFFSSAGANALEMMYSIENIADGQELTAQLFFQEDERGQWQLSEVLEQAWQPMNPDKLTFGYTHSVYWFRLDFKNTSKDSHQRLLAVNYPVIDYIDLYTNKNQSNDWQLQQLGDKYPYSERLVNNRNFVIPIDLAAGESIQLVFRVETSSSMQFPLTLWQEQSFSDVSQLQMFGMGLYYGIMLVMVLYNLFIFFAIRETNYLYYVLYVACLALFFSSLQGLSFQYLWPNATEWNDRSIIFFLSLSIVFGILFTRNFLHLNKNAPLNFLLFFLSGILLLLVFFSSVLSYHIMIQAVIVVAFVCLVLAFFAGVVRWVQGYATARYYTIAWFSILFGGIILALNKFNIVPRNFFTENIVQIGSAAEVILLSFALADRLNREKRKRYKAQIQALENERLLRVAKQKAYDVQKQANETLELRVKERTLELEEANKQLELMSITDALTNIRNRRYFDQTLQHEVARAVREQEHISVLIIDVDYFKQVNDAYGHQAGDEVLKAVANKLSQLISRSTDLLARFGGEEFVVILPNTTIEGAAHVAEIIRSAMEELCFEGVADNLTIKVSIGVYGAVPTIESNHEHWVRYADEALYQAKESGRDQVVVYQA